MLRRCLGCMEEYEEEYEVCPHCGYVYGQQAELEYHLSPGTMLAGRYQVGRVLGFGGFGITYIGWDTLLQRKIAVKEYLPSEYATRTVEQTCITVFSAEKEEKFATGLKKFEEEAKRLAKFQEVEGIVQIYDTVLENNTAYIIMEYLEGETLKSRLEREKTMSVDETINLMLPVLRSLEMVHEEEILHRDIAPDNIFLYKDEEGQERAKLLDFGAARFATTRHSRSLSVLIKAGYSPIEQYSSKGEQGAWTDVYAVAATMYRMITGIVPQDAMERYVKDEVVPIHKTGVKIDKSTEAAIMNAMNITYEYRTHDTTAFIRELESDQVKRIREHIIRTDIGRWPKWLKAVTGTAAALVTTFVILLVTGVIHFNIITPHPIPLAEGMTRVPNVINMKESKATKKTTNSSLIFQILDKQYSNEIPAGKILSQTLLGGTVVKKESTLGVIVSAGVEKTYVPDVVNFMEEDAADMILAANLLYERSEESGDDAPGSVMSQDIEAGKEVDTGTQLNLVISTGRGFDSSVETEVPDVVGTDYADAKTLLLDKCLYLAKEDVVYSEEIPKGQIMEQTPAAGGSIAQDSTIMVVVSAGRGSTHVPDVQYKTLADAQMMLEGVNLVVKIEYEDSDTVAAGNVIRQSVEAGEEVEMGTTVTIYISNGNDKADNSLTAEDAVITQEVQDEADEQIENAQPVEPDKKPDESDKKPETPKDTKAEVPNVTGIDSATAKKKIEAAGFICPITEAYSDTVAEGMVISQGVPGGTKTEKGTPVPLIVSKGPEMVNVPDVKGMTQTTAKSMIESVGLKCEITKEFNANVKANCVISQSESADSSVPKNSTTVMITVSKGPQAPVNDIDGKWSSTYVDVSREYYKVETVKISQVRTKQWSESSSETMSGWTRDDSKTEKHEGSWSSWSSTKVADKKNREFDAPRTVTDIAAYTEKIYHFWGAKLGNNNVDCLPYPANGYDYYFESSDQNPALVNNNIYFKEFKIAEQGKMGYRLWNATGNHWQAMEWADELWFFKQEISHPAVTHQEYRYRDNTYTYHFWKWSAWSAWKEGTQSTTATQEANNKTAYKYTLLK